MQQGDLIELTIHDLNSQGAGVGRHENQVVFVQDTVPGDHLNVRVTRLKRQYAFGKIQEILKPSEKRRRPPCIVADKCGGCQWLQVEDALQQDIKTKEIAQALQRIGGFEDLKIEPILTGDSSFGYRNKSTYPFGRSQQGQLQAGYYRKGSHQLVNLNQCPIQDDRLNPLLKAVKQDIADRGWSIYNETKHRGKLRHLAFRIGYHTGEILLTLITTSADLPKLQEQAAAWLEQYPDVVGVCVNISDRKGNLIFGKKTWAIAGRDYLNETFAGLSLQLKPETFFQVNTPVAEQLLERVFQRLEFTGEETVIDAYCGVGTFSLPLAKRVKQVIGIEVQASSIQQANVNAAVNHIHNTEFKVGKVEEVLPDLSENADIVFIDPPRKGCDRRVIEALRQLRPRQIIYVSCSPSTLARDLKLLCDGESYHLDWVQPADFFPQTPHVECAVLLQKR